ncbi:MAG: hypothetical protein IPP84_05280 [Propionivibrio sp.]|nr:hypothetical protein [Propionivibrio sp.]
MDKKTDIARKPMRAKAVHIRAYIQEFVKKNPISDEELKAQYDEIKSKLGNTGIQGPPYSGQRRG